MGVGDTKCIPIGVTLLYILDIRAYRCQSAMCAIVDDESHGEAFVGIGLD